MPRTIDLLFFFACTLALYLAQVSGQDTGPGNPRQVEVFVNVYDHPKTGFSCAGKQPGQYYADPATKCAVYYVCIPNPVGTLSPQSFACPNGTIFSQATRVCRPHEEVFCPLAARYYGNTQGQIDTNEEYEPLPVPVPVPIQPIAQSPPRRQSAPRHSPAPKPQPQALPPQPAPQPVQPKPVAVSQPSSNLFNSNSNRFRNSRTFSAPSTTTTTTPAPLPAAPAGPALGDYEYDYDAGGYNETGAANAASSVHAQIIENIAEAIAKDSKESAKASEEKKVSRRKRQSEPWMLSRRKGQLMEAISDIMGGEDAYTPSPVSFTCEDKVPGIAYADMQSGCSKFYVCVTIAKGKLRPYHLACDQGKRFNQALGMCDTGLTEKTCTHSERYYAYNKWHKASKKHFLDSAKKLSSHQ